MAKVCPRGGGIPGADFSSAPAQVPTFTDQRIVKFEREVRPVKPKVVVAVQPMTLFFLLKEDGCECLTESGVLIII